MNKIKKERKIVSRGTQRMCVNDIINHHSLLLPFLFFFSLSNHITFVWDGTSACVCMYCAFEHVYDHLWQAVTHVMTITILSDEIFLHKDIVFNFIISRPFCFFFFSSLNLISCTNFFSSLVSNNRLFLSRERERNKMEKIENQMKFLGCCHTHILNKIHLQWSKHLILLRHV